MKFKIKPAFTVAGMVFIMFALLFASNFINIGALAQTENVFLAVIILQLVIFILPGIIYCKYRGTHLKRSLRLKRFDLKSLLLTLCSFFLMVFLTSIVKLGLYTIGYYNTDFSLYQNYLPMNSTSAVTLTYIVITVCIVPAFTEEFVFRSIVLGEYTNIKCSKLAAVLLSSGLFAMMHFNIYQLPVYFAGGVVLGYLTIITDSVFPAMIVHLLNNIFSLLFESQLLRLITQTDSVIFVLFILFIMFMIFLFLCLQITEDIYYKKGINGVSSPTVSKTKKTKGILSISVQALLSPTYIACVLLFTVAIFVLK